PDRLGASGGRGSPKDVLPAPDARHHEGDHEPADDGVCGNKGEEPPRPALLLRCCALVAMEERRRPFEWKRDDGKGHRGHAPVKVPSDRRYRGRIGYPHARLSLKVRRTAEKARYINDGR